MMKRYLPYILLTAGIMLPLLWPGYVLTVDLVFTPSIRLPESVTNDYLWRTLLFVCNQIIPSQIIEKAILVAIPLSSAIGMHRLLELLITRTGTGLIFQSPVRPLTRGKTIFEPVVSKSPFPAPLRLSLPNDWNISPIQQQWALYAAGIFYAVNPFTYSRLMAGQYAVLLGYALVPFFVRALLEFLAKPGYQSLRWVIGVALVISIISIHTLGSLFIITLVAAGIGAWQQRKNVSVLKKYVTFGVAGIAVFVLASGYWLIPLLLGQNDTAQTIQQFDQAHTDAFATTGNNGLAQLFNILNLQGFWLESKGQYALPQDILPGWGTVRLLIWAAIGWGLVWSWRQARLLATGLSAIAVTAIALSLGLPGQLLTAIGYREPQKFVGLLALCFAICIAVAGLRVLASMRARSESRAGIAAAVLILVVLLFTPTMYWGAKGQLTARQYPGDWHSTNRFLNNQPGEFGTLFLPWHQYMGFGFTGRIIANPAEPFFDRPVITSHDPEVGSITPPSDNTRDAITNALQRRHEPGKVLTRTLQDENIRFVVLAKDADYRKYDYLGVTEGLTLIRETDTLQLYRVNNSMKGAR